MYRNLYHIGGLIFPAMIILISQKAALYVCGILFLIILIFDMFRLQWKELNLLIIKKLPIRFKRKEIKNLTGSPFFLGGCFLTLLLFKPAYAMGGIIYLSIGDMCAVTIGKNFGRINIFEKTFEGTLAFIISTLIVMMLLKFAGTPYLSELSLFGIIAGSLICGLVEILPVQIDDNLTIPIAGAFILKLLG